MSHERKSIRIAVVGASPCGDCTAACCRRTVSEYAVLLQGDDERRRFRPWSIDLPVKAEGRVVVERVIPYRADIARCPFLGDDELCTIYEDRPQACRDFECTRHFDPRRGHGYFLQGNPGVVRLLRSC